MRWPSEYLPGITLDEINELAREWTTDENMLAMITAQEKEGVRVPDESQVIGIIKSIKGKKLDPYIDNVSDVPLLPVPPVPSKVIKRTDDKNFGYYGTDFR